MYFPTIFPALHSEHALTEFHTNNNNLHRCKKIADILYRSREPRIQVSTFIAGVEK
jgi:hypothetical protein